MSRAIQPLDVVLANARATLAWFGDRPLDTLDESNGYHLALGIVDLLGESQPCIFEEPDITVDGCFVDIGKTFGIGRLKVETSDLRALCAMWLRAADVADARAAGMK